MQAPRFIAITPLRENQLGAIESEAAQLSMNAITADPTAAPVASGKTPRVLYADDLEELRDVMRLSLAREGYTVDCAPDGQVAYERIAAEPDVFDLLITDHHMPNMDGLALVMAVRELPFRGKIMVFSSELDAEVATVYRRLKVDHLLYKPVYPSVLRQVLTDLGLPSRATSASNVAPVLRAAS